MRADIGFKFREKKELYILGEWTDKIPVLKIRHKYGWNCNLLLSSSNKAFSEINSNFIEY